MIIGIVNVSVHFEDSFVFEELASRGLFNSVMVLIVWDL